MIAYVLKEILDVKIQILYITINFLKNNNHLKPELMKKIIYLAMCLLLTSTVVFAQKFNKIETIDDGATSESGSVPCLNETQRAEIKTILHENVNQLKQALNDI